MSICRHYIISGRVQGVYYRSFLKDVAWRIGVTGWGKNSPDGTVEAFACGAEEQLNEFEKELKVGSEASVVDSVKVSDSDYKNFNDFTIISAE
jgi:acylphosphatase